MTSGGYTEGSGPKAKNWLGATLALLSGGDVSSAAVCRAAGEEGSRGYLRFSGSSLALNSTRPSLGIAAMGGVSHADPARLAERSVTRRQQPAAVTHGARPRTRAPRWGGRFGVGCCKRGGGCSMESSGKQADHKILGIARSDGARSRQPSPSLRNTLMSEVVGDGYTPRVRYKCTLCTWGAGGEPRTGACTQRGCDRPNASGFVTRKSPGLLPSRAGCSPHTPTPFSQPLAGQPYSCPITGEYAQCVAGCKLQQKEGNVGARRERNGVLGDRG